MKKLTLLTLVAVFCACGEGADVVDNIDSTPEISIDSLKTDLGSSEPKEDEIIEKNDLTEQHLIGTVKTLSTHIFEIDDQGDQQGMGGYSEDYTFNDAGFITQCETFGCCGAEPEFIRYKRDENNLLTHKIFFYKENDDPVDESGEYYEKHKYFYDDSGVLVKIKVAGFDQKLREEISFKYDDNGTVRKKEIFNVDNEETEVVKYTYSDFEEVETYFDSNGEFDYKVVFIYDENRMLIEREMHLTDGHIQQQKFTYKYDADSNWTEKLTIYRYILPDGSKEEWRNSTKEKRGIQYYSE